MGQIAKGKKKGRPSKADLARRSAESPAPAASQPDNRRSLRRRNVRYNIIDYDGDYLDEDEDERRREKKKLKLVEKLNSDEEETRGEDGVEENESAPPSGTRAESRVRHKPEEEEEGNRGEIEAAGEENLDWESEEGTGKGRKVDLKGLHCVSGTPPKPPSGIPLPDKRTLDLILDKLQKKDTYGVFADPVDPEELPDYHEVIEHPMDFATVRKKLANGSYPTLEQFENDVFLICSNAMEYNSADTIYHKQARSIQEQGQKKFEKLRMKFERSQVELKPEQKSVSNSWVKKQPKKPLGRASQEPVGSDFTSGATLATTGDIQPTSYYPMLGGSYERHGNIDGIVEGNAFLIDANQGKAENVLQGTGLLSKLGRKSFVHDEDRRASYNMSGQPIIRSDSIFMTFEGEIKQLVTVGLHAEYSYARSLARFSATLGPTAWKVASHRIQQALPAGSKFGRGWVGEYEPLSTPVLMLDNLVQKDTSIVRKLHSTTELIKDRNSKNAEPTIEGKQSSDCPASRFASERKSSLFCSAGIRPDAPVNLLNQKQNVLSRNFSKSESQGLKQVELNTEPPSNQNNSSLVAKFPCNALTALSRPGEMVPRDTSAVPSVPFKQPDTNGVVSGELPNGKVMNTSLNRPVTGPSSKSTSDQASRAATLIHGEEQSFSDPVQLMRMFSERAQKQQQSPNCSPGDTVPVTPPDPSGQRGDSANASVAAVRAWMSVGAAGRFKQGPDNSSSPKSQISSNSLCNPKREFHQHISQIRGDFPSGKNNFPFQALVPQGAVSQFPNRPTVVPPSVPADPSRFQMQSPWRGLSPCSQPRPKQETLPPDLNIDFHSPGSPAKQSSGVESQQPDLALQL